MEIGNFHLNFKIMAFPNVIKLTWDKDICPYVVAYIICIKNMRDEFLYDHTCVVCLTLNVIHTT